MQVQAKFKIYKITNLINNKIYIGQTTGKLKTRFNNHFYKKKGGCPVLNKALHKYGRENFSIECLDTASNSEELDRLEEYYIELYNSTCPNGYNMLSKANRPPPHTEKSKQKISEALRGRKKASSHREKLSEAMKRNHQDSEYREQFISRMKEAASYKKLPYTTRGVFATDVITNEKLYFESVMEAARAMGNPNGSYHITSAIKKSPRRNGYKHSGIYKGYKWSYA